MVTPTLYQRVLTDFDRLPDAVKSFHAQTVETTWEGRATVQRGTNIPSRMIGAVFGFPKSSNNANCVVTITPDENGELWVRNFDGARFSSRQMKGKRPDEIVEQFGPFRFDVQFERVDDRLNLRPVGWSLLRVRLPLRLCPNGPAFENEREGKFCFNVEIKAPFVGLIVAYSGWLRRTGTS